MTSPDFVDGSWLLDDEPDTQSGLTFDFSEPLQSTKPREAATRPSSIREALLCFLDENL